LRGFLHGLIFKEEYLMQNPEEELKQYRQQIYKDVVFLMNTRFKLLKEFADGKIN